MVTSFLAPVFGQIAMAGMVMQQGNGWYLGFVIPAIIGTLASAAAMLVQMRASRRADDGSAAETTEAGTSGAAAPAADIASAQGIAALAGGMTPPPALETLLFPDVPASRVRRPQHAWRAVSHAWACEGARLRTLLDVPIGVGLAVPASADAATASDRLVPHLATLGIVRQGPHALVAGTTGSGKSVFLESWCLAMACLAPADRVHFVFLDFKGGAAFRELHRLPHCVGNVSDLSLAHATRALRALEAELHRREQLLAEQGAATMDELSCPCPRLVVVVDEFAALRQRMPGYVDRLVSLASLGRSLGMNLIICTQNPLGQVSADMKANLNLNVCLRVRDGLQSAELIGAPHAAAISPRTPGTAFINDGAGLSLVRCSPCSCTGTLVEACCRAARFHDIASPQPLFSPPLPRRVTAAQLCEYAGASQIDATRDAPPDAGNAASPDADSHDRQAPPAGLRGLTVGLHDQTVGLPAALPVGLPVGLRDDGIHVAPWRLALGATGGNVAVIGAAGCGKSTALGAIRQAARRAGWLVLPGSAPWLARLVAPDGAVTLLADDADALLDPLASSAESRTFRDALGDRRTTVVFAVTSTRHVRYPEDCTRRIVFPTPDKSTNVLMGIPTPLAATLCEEDWRTPGRAVMVGGSSYLVQWCDVQWCDDAAPGEAASAADCAAGKILRENP